MQEQLNVIAGAYPALPKIDADGIYGPRTEEAVEKRAISESADRKSRLPYLVQDIGNLCRCFENCRASVRERGCVSGSILSIIDRKG